MISKIKSFFESDDKKKLLENFFSLSFLQIVNYILPLLTLPYLVRVLGSEYFGVLSFATSIVTIFKIITDYGFNLTATREISIHRENAKKVSEIFNAVLIIKILLTFLNLIFLTILVFSFDKFTEHQSIYFLTFGTIIGQVLFPVWFFQGLENMKYVTILNTIGKIIFTVLIFIFIKEKEEFYFVPIINSLGFLVTGILSLVIIRKKFNIQFEIPPFSRIIHYLKDGWYVFISNLANGFYSNSTIFLLGFFTNNSIVGYYSAGERLIKVIQNMLNPFFQTIYPYFAKKGTEASKNTLKSMKKILIVLGGFTLVISLFVFIFADLIVFTIFGDEFVDSIIIVKIMSILPFTYALTNIFGTQIMLNFGRQKQYGRIFIIATILNLILSFILIPLFKGVGTAITSLTTEVFFIVVMFVYIQNTGLKIIEFSKVKTLTQ